MRASISLLLLRDPHIRACLDVWFPTETKQQDLGHTSVLYISLYGHRLLFPLLNKPLLHFSAFVLAWSLVPSYIRITHFASFIALFVYCCWSKKNLIRLWCFLAYTAYHAFQFEILIYSLHPWISVYLALNFVHKRVYFSLLNEFLISNKNFFSLITGKSSSIAFPHFATYT
jgi:hypothetical protein